VVDAAVVTWPKDSKGPKTKQAVNTTAVGAFGGAFWGMLFGLLFFLPLLGLVLGAASGALGGAFADIGSMTTSSKRRAIRSRLEPRRFS
jgi:uncharacterized membrane protein